MRFHPQTPVLLAMIAMLSACGKPAEPAAGSAPPAAATKQQADSPFLRNGELLSVNVDAMPRQVFIAKMAELTGVKITAEGDNTQPVTVHAEDATLRKVLSQAIADAPYSVTMQYTNLQDSFPASVSIGRYHAGVMNSVMHQNMMPTQAVALRQPLGKPAGAVPAQKATEEPEEPDMMAMQPDDQVKYFLGKSTEDQVSAIFEMEPTPEQSELMERLMQKDVASEVKLEMLDSLSNGEYATSAPAIKIALESTNAEVATKAAEVMGEMGSAKDIPALKKLAETGADEDVRQAAQDAIDSLQP